MDLKDFFQENTHRQIYKLDHYFDIYDKHFGIFRDKEVVILEIGIYQGGSLQMWKSYFGPKAKIFGIDINPECKKFEEENVTIFIGSQSDGSFLRHVKTSIPLIDVLIDDGGHTMKQQKTSFSELFYHLKPQGVYLCEDLHTSYWLEYGGGYRRKGTFIEFSKNLIDQLNAYHSEQRVLQPTPFTDFTHSIHFYESVVVIEKRPRKKPTEVISGFSSFEQLKTSHKNSLKYYILFYTNTLLRFFKLPSFRW